MNGSTAIQPEEIERLFKQEYIFIYFFALSGMFLERKNNVAQWVMSVHDIYNNRQCIPYEPGLPNQIKLIQFSTYWSPASTQTFLNRPKRMFSSGLEFHILWVVGLTSLCVNGLPTPLICILQY